MMARMGHEYEPMTSADGILFHRRESHNVPESQLYDRFFDFKNRHRLADMLQSLTKIIFNINIIINILCVYEQLAMFKEA